jgi:hypothetical protein
MEVDVNPSSRPRRFDQRLLVLLSFAAAAMPVSPVSLAAQTVVLRGRVIALGRTLPDTFRIRLVGLGDPRMLRGGEFEIEVPASTNEVEVQTTDTNWSIVYPPSGRLPVPRGEARAVVVVGEPVEQTITRALAERIRASEQLLAANGLQAERLGGVEDGIQQILARLDLREEDLRDEAARKQRQADVFPEIAATIERYVAEAKDLHTTLSLTPSAVADEKEKIRQNALAAISEAVLSYSAAWDSIGSRRARFETEVEHYWEEGPLLRRDLAGFFDTVVEPLHRSRIFVINADLVKIQTAIQASRSDREFEDAMRRVSDTVTAMQTDLAQLEARAARIIEQLRPE